MEIQMRATGDVTRLDGVECRVWEGVTASGIPCKVFVHRVAVRRDADTSQFDRELKEQMPPERTVPLSKIL